MTHVFPPNIWISQASHLSIFLFFQKELILSLAQFEYTPNRFLRAKPVWYIALDQAMVYVEGLGEYCVCVLGRREVFMKYANSWKLEDIQLKWNGEVRFLKKWDTN